MDALNRVLDALNLYVGSKGWWFPYVLLGTGIFFTFYLRFPQLRFFSHAIDVVRGKYEKKEHPGDTTHFQSLATALSGTVGTGNIGGVGLALFTGGPAALFWMWVTAFFGMTLKFVECTLSHKYRELDEQNNIAGGPMYYMKHKLKMPWLAVIFAIATVICSFGTGNMPQINNMAASIQSSFGVPSWLTGLVLSFFLFMIIIGGIKRIAKVTEKLVPIMAIVYFIGALIVIFSNVANIIPSLKAVLGGVFTHSAALGGFLGATFSFAFTNGVGQGIFSNEAGQGSAAIAHSAAKADEPVSEGIVSILEPFIDTLIICTLTGLVILSSGAWTKKVDNLFQRADMEFVAGHYDQAAPGDAMRLYKHINGSSGDDVTQFSGEIGVDNGRMVAGNECTLLHARSIAEDVSFRKEGKLFSGKLRVEKGKLADSGVEVRGKSLVHSAVLTTEAFKMSVLGENGKFIVSIGLLLFAFSTVISWSYYGDRAITYLLGAKFVFPYRVVYIVAFFVASLINTSIIWSLANVAIVMMALPNLFGILMLHKDMKSSVGAYWKKFKTEHPEEARKLRLRELKD